MPGTLIRNGHVVTVDAQRNVFAGGFVAIENGRIVEAGPADQAPPAERFETIVDAKGCIVTARPDQPAPASLVHAVQGHGRWHAAGRLGKRTPVAAVAQHGRRRDAHCERHGRHGNAGDRHHHFAQSFGDHHDAGDGARLDRAGRRNRHAAYLRQGIALPHARQSAPSARASTRRLRPTRKNTGAGTTARMAAYAWP